MKRIVFAALLAIGALPLSIPTMAQLSTPVPNATAAGTTVNELAIINTSGQAVIATTSSTAVPSYIVSGNAGTSQSALLGDPGQQFACVMDSTIASAAGGYYVTPSTTTAGYCHASPSAPAAGTWLVGFLISSSTVSGSTAQVFTVNQFYGGTGGGLPSNTAGQTFLGAGGNSANATNEVTMGGTSSTPVGFGGVEVTAPFYVDTYQATGTIATFNGSCASGTTTSCPITNGGSLDPNGGVVLTGLADGNGDQEYIHYSSATSTTITFATSGRGYWGSTAATHGTGLQLILVTGARVQSATSVPYEVQLQTGNTIIGNASATNVLSALNVGQFLATNNTFFDLSGQIVMKSGVIIGDDTLQLNAAALSMTNDDANTTLALAGNNLDYAITTQSITATTLTAITNAQTPTLRANGTTAANGVGGVLSSHCKIIWNQATGGTVQFGVKANNTPADIWVSEQDSPGSYLAPTYTTITSTTATATSGTLTPSAFGTTYASDLWIAMNPGTSNNISIQLYALTSSGSDTLTIEPGTGCSGWN